MVDRKLKSMGGFFISLESIKNINSADFQKWSSKSQSFSQMMRQGEKNNFY